MITCVAVVALVPILLVTPTAGATGATSDEWPLDSHHLRADQIWQTTKGDGITVAVVDTGVEGSHPDLATQVLPGTGFVGVPADDGRTDVSDDSHGTSIAGIIAGNGKGSGMTGLAPDAKILPVRVSLNATIQPLEVAKGIFYAADHRANIINVSIDTTDPDPNLKAAVDYALSKNVVVVASAGNAGQSGDAPMYPASFPGVVNVTGIDENNHFWPLSESGPQSTLAAPAADIFSTNDRNGYLRGDGTSYAAPYVAAAAALVWSRYPHLNAPQVVRQLVNTADRHGDSPHDDQYGFGIVNPLRAVTTPPSSDGGIPSVVPEESGSGRLPIASGTAAGVIVVAGTVIVLVRRRRSRGRA